MAKGKMLSSKSATFAKGGGGHMVGKQHAGMKAPYVTGKGDKGSGGKFAKGGGGHMFGKQSASPAPGGRSGKGG
jgi:hypothetical protein